MLDLVKMVAVIEIVRGMSAHSPFFLIFAYSLQLFTLSGMLHKITMNVSVTSSHCASSSGSVTVATTLFTSRLDRLGTSYG